MSSIAIANVTFDSVEDDLLLGFELLEPKSDSGTDRYCLNLSGWALGRKSLARELQLWHRDMLLKSIMVNLPSPEASRRFPDVPGKDACGFRTNLGMLGVDLHFNIEVKVVFRNSQVQRCATIIGSRQGITTSHRPKLNPIILTSLARTGTTRFMQTLCYHPSVAVLDRYPFEARPACYWLHMVKVLAEPSNGRNTFEANSAAIPPCPINSRPLTDDVPLGLWFGIDYVVRLAEWAQQNIDQVYERIGGNGSSSRSISFFAEKCLPCHLQPMFRELYPSGKEIVLVRDFRDMICSMIAFNNKRGFATFGREAVTSDAEFVFSKRADVLKLLEALCRGAERLLCIRYEDLVLSPVETIQKVFEYLQVDSSDEITKDIVEKQIEESKAIVHHRTSVDVASSIGRWRQDLSPKLQAICNEVYGDLLPEFGYEK